jgi:hypothetical protein
MHSLTKILAELGRYQAQREYTSPFQPSTKKRDDRNSGFAIRKKLIQCVRDR